MGADCNTGVWDGPPISTLELLGLWVSHSHLVLGQLMPGPLLKVGGGILMSNLEVGG